jgi:hypothetical protein
LNFVNVNNINESNRNNGFAAYWLSILFYFIITEIVIVFRDFDLLFSGQLWLNRLTFAGLFLLNIIQGISHKARPVVVLVATYAGLTLLYKETALLNQLFYPVMGSTINTVGRGYCLVINLLLSFRKLWMGRYGVNLCFWAILLII